MRNEQSETKTVNRINFQGVIGIILLIPPLLSVIFFLLSVFSSDTGSSYSSTGKVPQLKNLSSDWTGSFDTGGYTSAAPIYLGLMAIGGAILLSRGVKKVRIKPDQISKDS